MADPKGPHIHIVLSIAEEVEDPRKPRGVRHLLVDLLVIALLAMLCGADTVEEFQDYGEENEDWLRTFLELPHGIPSHYTFLRVFAMLAPKAFEGFFVRWTESLGWEPGPHHIAIDGKTVRGSLDRAAGIKGLHMVGAWLREHDLVLGQVKTDQKSNEITAIPELLKMLDLKQATVTIDAMGCQRDIAEAIRGYQAHYVLAVKDNQPTLHEQTTSSATPRSQRRTCTSWSAATGALRTRCTGPWTWPSGKTTPASACRTPPPTWPCSAASPSTSSARPRPRRAKA